MVRVSGEPSGDQAVDNENVYVANTLSKPLRLTSKAARSSSPLFRTIPDCPLHAWRPLAGNFAVPFRLSWSTRGGRLFSCKLSLKASTARLSSDDAERLERTEEVGVFLARRLDMGVLLGSARARRRCFAVLRLAASKTTLLSTSRGRKGCKAECLAHRCLSGQAKLSSWPSGSAIWKKRSPHSASRGGASIR